MGAPAGPFKGCVTLAGTESVADCNMNSKEHMARLRWACRRGMLELDVLLLPFVEGFESLSDEQQKDFERLLACDDPELFSWFMGHVPCPDPALALLVRQILDAPRLPA